MNRLTFLAGKEYIAPSDKNTRSNFGETAARRSFSLRPEIEKNTRRRGSFSTTMVRRMSPLLGTFRTSRDVRLESGMRTNAVVHRRI
jgi:hypothetical protein